MIRKIHNCVSRHILKREYQNQTFLRFNERPVEYAFIFRKMSELYPTKILDIGTGTTALPHLMRGCGAIVSASDNITDYWPRGMFNRHYHIILDDITKTRINDKFDFITCISVLQHIESSDTAISSLISLLKPGGHLILSFPYSENRYVRNVYELPGSSYGQGNPYIVQSTSRDVLNRWFTGKNIKIVEQEYWQFWEGDYWTVGSQIIPPQKVSQPDKHQLTCIHCQLIA